MYMHFAYYNIKEEVVGHVVYVRKKRNRHRVLMGKPVRKNRLEDLCVDYRKLYLKELGWEGADGTSSGPLQTR
jgi:hypothetical protein